MKSVTIIEFLTKSFELKMFYIRSWRIRTTMRLVDTELPTGDLMLYIASGKYTYQFEGEIYTIDELDVTKAPIKWESEITVPKGFLPNIDKSVKTLYGRLLLNAIGFTEEYGDLIPYHNAEFFPNTFHKEYYRLYRAGKIDRVEQLINSTSRLHMLEADAEFGVPAASIETFTTHPDMSKVVKQQLELYKDELSNPATAPKMDAVTGQLDRKHIEGTQAEKFFISDKLYDTVRKRTYSMYGSETGLDGKPTEIIGRPLRDGVDLSKMPIWVDTSRNGAISRGGMTALGGYEVKLDDAAYGHLEVSEGDCKTKRGLLVRVKEDNKDRYLGMRLLSNNDPLTEAMLSKQVGKVLTIRAPSHCDLETNYCEMCMGINTAKNTYAIPSGVSTLDSTSMDSMMQASHAKAFKSIRINLETDLS